MTAAIILMGGQGERLPGPLPKQFRLIKGVKVYQRTLASFQQTMLFQQIILVAPASYVETIRAECPDVTVVAGGETRRQSSYKGILACNSAVRYVVIHDAVRPLVSIRIIEDNVKALASYEAVDTCLPSADTIVHRKGEFVEAIPDRTFLWRGQTPQSFSYDLIRRAHEQLPLQQAHVDDCRLVLDLGIKPFIVLGEERNMKITTEEDLLFIESLCS